MTITGTSVSWNIFWILTTLNPPRVMPSNIITPSCSRCREPLTIRIKDVVASVPSTVIWVRRTPSSHFPARKRVPITMTCSRLWGTNGASSKPRILISGLMFLNFLMFFKISRSLLFFGGFLGGFFSSFFGLLFGFLSFSFSITIRFYELFKFITSGFKSFSSVF